MASTTLMTKAVKTPGVGGRCCLTPTESNMKGIGLCRESMIVSVEQMIQKSITFALEEASPLHLQIMKSLHKESKSRIGCRSTSRGSLVKTIVLDAARNSKCGICLEKIQDATYLNPCNHRFCFACIQNWSKKKVLCPLCKQRFYSFFHIVNTKGTFCEYVLPLSDDSFPHSETRIGHASSSSQRSASPPDSGIVHDEISGTLSQTEKDVYQLMRQFAVTKRPGNIDIITLGKFKAHAVVQFRRALYHAGLLVQKTHYPDLYRNASAEYFSRHPDSFDRLIPWLKRELKVLCGNQKSLIQTLQSFILNNMTQHDLRSKEFEDLLRPHLHHFTSHFLHELISFVQSPFTIKKYDWHSTYECPPLPKEGSDSFISSSTSDDEHSQLPDDDQAPETDGNLDGGNLGSPQSCSENDPSAVVDGTQYPNKEGNNLEDLTSTGMEKDGHSSDNFIQNQGVSLPPNPSVQPSLLHNQTLPCKNENEKIGEPDPVQTCSSKNVEPFEDSSNLLASGDYNISNCNNGEIVAIPNEQHVSKGETIQFQQPDVYTNYSRCSSSERCTTVSPGRKNVFKKRGSRGIECYAEERHGRQSRARNYQERKQTTNYTRIGERRPRTEAEKPRCQDVSLFHQNKMLLPFKNENIVTRNISKSRYQQSNHFTKLRNKDYDNLRNSPASEPSWRYLYYKQDYERYRYEEFMRQKAGEPRFYHPHMLTGSKGRSYFSPENRTSAHQESLAKGWNYSETHRSAGRPKSRFVALGPERGSFEKLGRRRKHKSHHLESGYAKGGARYFQDYIV
ncbi:E3 ubiquitin-protein ligase Topors-like [Sphaerodactylus townsendi]|uniref:E3 ubiquitin-protein ligase Topors-like n=1 Tax=Sphaerodactylus townsendi TaxID=933632 RepID=UPI0020274E1E|nr:E3 ubiquitin-protein ligase Topors-like [Sphaerodactylus townsendi]